MFLKQKLLFKADPLIALTVVGGLFFTLFAISVMANSGGEVTSQKTANAIAIDGNLDESEWTAALAISSPLQDIVLDPRAHGQDWYQLLPCGQGEDPPCGNTNGGGLRVTRGQVDGDDDLSVRWATLWDEDYLYFGFDVTDDSVHAYANDVATRDGYIDGFWLLFDTRNDAPLFEFPNHEFNSKEVANNSTYEADDIYWIFGPLTSGGTSTAWSSDGSFNPDLGDPANGHVAAQETGNGYTAEARLPWSVFESPYGGPLTPTNGLVIGFDITFTDIDGDPPGSYAAPLGGAMAWSSDFENDNSPGVLGDLIISTELVAEPSSVSPSGKLPTMWGDIKGQY
jgi:hypothetical protein